MTRRFRSVRMFGWQLDYRPDGWLPLNVREGDRRGWHILWLGALGCVTLGRLRKPPPLTVTITADNTQFVAAMIRTQFQVTELESIRCHRLRLEEQRLMGLLFVERLLDDWRAELGIDRPAS